MEEVTKWTKVKVGDTGNVFTGRTPSTKCPEYFGNEFLFITPGDMHQGKHVCTTERGLSTLGANLLRRIQLPPKSVCVSCIGWQMGEAVMTSTTSFTNQQINSIVPNDYVDADFLYYSFVPRKQELLSIASATGVRTPIMNKSDFCNLQVMLPPLSTQQKIAFLLSAYDDLIENNIKRIKILEEMAQTIYNEWFGKFRFPGHENVNLVESELGMIPEGWKIKKVKDVLKRLKAGNVYTESMVQKSGNVPVIDQSRSNYLGFHNNEADHKASSKSPIIIFGDHTCKMQLLVEPFSVGPNVVPFISKENDYSIYYLYYLVNNLVVTREYKRHWTDLTNKTIPLTDASISHIFGDLVEPVFQTIECLRKRILNLSETRDLLLPRLISGEVNVSEIDIDVGGFTA